LFKNSSTVDKGKTLLAKRERGKTQRRKSYVASCLCMSADMWRSSRKGDIDMWAWLITIYEPMIYKAQCVMLLMQAASIIWARDSRARNSRFPGPNPLPLAHVMDAARIKSIMHGAV
jgi:hypothetical protein